MGAVMFDPVRDVAEGLAPSLVTSAGGGAAEAVPVAVVTSAALSVTRIVELSEPELVESDDVMLPLPEDERLPLLVPVTEDESEDDVLELFVTRRPDSHWEIV